MLLETAYFQWTTKVSFSKNHCHLFLYKDLSKNTEKSSHGYTELLLYAELFNFFPNSPRLESKNRDQMYFSLSPSQVFKLNPSAHVDPADPGRLDPPL